MKLLVVEEEVKTSQVIQHGLEESQFDLNVAFDGQIARRLALRNIHSAIITDLMLPRLNECYVVNCGPKA
jgi:two-component system copper resistance phosphate regulon response regulator CusR